MRLPFGFGRRSSSGDGAAGGGASAGSDAASLGTDAGAPTQAAAREPGAWADLPPIQRTAGSMPLVAAPGSFVEALPGFRGLPPIVQPLGHEVSPLATPGLVVAHARPVVAAAGGALPAPVQRRASRGARPEAASAPTGDADAGAASEVPGDGAAAPAEVGPVAPIRSLPTVSRMTIRMPDRPLTSAEIAARPASVQRAAGGGGTSTPAPVARTGMRRAASSTSTPAAPTVSRAPAAAAPVVPPTAATPAQAPEPPLRPGLGAPLEVLPSSARPVGPSQADAIVTVPVSRQIATSAMPLATTRRSTVQRGVPEADSAPVASTAEASPSTRDPRGHRPVMGDLPALPVLTVARSTAAASAAAPNLGSQPTAASTPVVRPLVGARPIEPASRFEQSTTASDQETDDVVRLPSPWWAARDTQGAAPASNGGRSADVAPISVSRSVPNLAPDPTNDRLGPATHTGLPAGAASTARVRPVQRAATSAVALPIARPVAASSGRQAVATADQPEASAPIVQRLAAAAPPQEIVVQTAPSSGQVASPQPLPMGGGPVVQRAESGSTATSPGAPGRSETDLEELAQALFGRIRGRLRSELIHDREAKGLSFDNV